MMVLTRTRSSVRGEAFSTTEATPTTSEATPEATPEVALSDVIPTVPSITSTESTETPMEISTESTTTAPTAPTMDTLNPPPQTIPAGKVYGVNGLDTPITMEQLQQDNQVMRDQIAVCLEFKRMIENMFMKDRALLQTGALRPYLDHTKNALKHYRMIRRAFDNRLEGNIENLDQEGMSKCGSPECTIPGCYEGPSGGCAGLNGGENQTAQNPNFQNQTIQNQSIQNPTAQNQQKVLESRMSNASPNKPSVSKKPFSFYPSSSSSILIKPDPDGPSTSSSSIFGSTTTASGSNAHARTQQQQNSTTLQKRIKPEYNSDDESTPMDVSTQLGQPKPNPQVSQSRVSGSRFPGTFSGAPRLSGQLTPGGGAAPRLSGSSTTPMGIAASRATPPTPSSTPSSISTKVPASSLQKKDILVNVNGVPKIRCRVEDCDQLMDNEKDVVAHMVNHQKKDDTKKPQQ